MFDVVIVGAGVAGMIAARECLAAGLSVRLLEAKPQPGGRLHAEGTDTSKTLELGGQFFRLNTSPLLSTELHRYGLHTTTAMRCVRQFVLFDSKLHEMSQAFADNPGALRLLVSSVLKLTRQLSVEQLRSELEQLSAQKGLISLGLPPLIERWLQGWAEQYAGTSLESISMASMLGLVEAGRGSMRSAALESGEYICPSTRALTDAIWQEVSKSGELEHVVHEINPQPDGTGFLVRGDANTTFARSVIIATPRNVIASGKVSVSTAWEGDIPLALREPQPGLGHKVWVRLDSNSPTDTIVLGELGGFRILALGERELDGSVWGVFFGNAATFKQDAAILDLDLDFETDHAIQAMWGDQVRILETRSHNWVSDPFALGAWTVAPTQTSDPIEELHANTPAGIAFAGADFSSRRGGVESALRSGFDAAERTVSYLASEGAKYD